MRRQNRRFEPNGKPKEAFAMISSPPFPSKVLASVYKNVVKRSCSLLRLTRWASASEMAFRGTLGSFRPAKRSTLARSC